MINQDAVLIMSTLPANESVQVLLFIALPLSLLVVGFLIHIAIQPNRFVATFPSFSVRIERVGRQEIFVTYREKNRELILVSAFTRDQELHVPIPPELSDEDRRSVVQNLTLGLAKLRYRYLIYRRLEPKKIPDEDRNAAIEELRRMGVDLSQAPGLVQQAVMPDWRNFAGQDPKELLPQVFSLMHKARGVQEAREILARSEG